MLCASFLVDQAPKKAAKKSPEKDEDMIEKMFRTMDLDRDGILTRVEAADMIKKAEEPGKDGKPGQSHSNCASYPQTCPCMRFVGAQG